MANRSSKTRLVYILAASHSGSTLLSLLLGAHPDVCTVGELKAARMDDKERYLCSCGTKIKECPFWNSISREMLRMGVTFTITDAGTDFKGIRSPYCQKLLAPLHRGRSLEKLRDIGLWLSPMWRRYLKNVQTRNTMLIQAIMSHTAKKVIVDSSKVGLRLKYLLRNPSLDVKIVRLVRDGRAVALTYMNTLEFADAINPSLRRGGLGDDGRHNLISMKEAAHRWLRSNEEAEEILKTIPAYQWIQTRYEDYCRNTKGVFSKLFKFIGVDPSKWIWPYLETFEHHVIGNGMRLEWDGSVMLDERWKYVLTKEELDTFDRIAGSMNRKLGY